jgi:hypothetical protein
MGNPIAQLQRYFNYYTGAEGSPSLLSPSLSSSGKGIRGDIEEVSDDNTSR